MTFSEENVVKPKHFNPPSGTFHNKGEILTRTGKNVIYLLSFLSIIMLARYLL